MTSSRDFDWDDVADDVVVPEQAAIAVDANRKGSVVIRQAGYYGPDEDMWIVVAPDRAPAVADAILRIAGQCGAEPRSRQTASPMDPTAAERQRRCRNRNRDWPVTDRDVTGRDGAQPLLLDHASGRPEGPQAHAHPTGAGRS